MSNCRSSDGDKVCIYRVQKPNLGMHRDGEDAYVESSLVMLLYDNDSQLGNFCKPRIEGQLFQVNRLHAFCMISILFL